MEWDGIDEESAIKVVWGTSLSAANLWLPDGGLEETARVFQHGSKKPGRVAWDWRDRGRDTDQDKAAIQRHLLRYLDPDSPNYEEDSGRHHLAHVVARALILMELEGVGID